MKMVGNEEKTQGFDGFKGLAGRGGFFFYAGTWRSIARRRSRPWPVKRLSSPDDPLESLYGPVVRSMPILCIKFQSNTFIIG